MLDLFLKLEGLMSRAITALTSALLALAACLGLLQVLSRFVFKFPFEWTEVLIRISLNWMVFIGVAVVFRMGSMITVDMMRRLMPHRYQRAHETVLLVLVLIFLALLGYWGADYARRGGTQTIIGLERISMFWAYLCIPVGCFCAAMSAIAHYLEPRPQAPQAEIENTI